jgi:hypothetical protein
MVNGGLVSKGAIMEIMEGIGGGHQTLYGSQCEKAITIRH